MRKSLPAIVSILMLGVSPLAAENWPQWRGPMLNGESAEKNLPVRWSTTENVTWKLAVPERSGSTPIVWGDHMFLNVGEGSNLAIWAVDRTNGTIRWKRPLGGGNRRMMKQQMSSPSPVTDGKSVWVMTGTGVLKSFDFAGKELWSRDIQADYGRFGTQWGYASSPLLFEDALYVQVLHGMHTDDPSYLLRIDKATGKTVWRVLRTTRARFESPDAYTTPALLRVGNSTEIVITGGDVVTGHDPANGQELWRADGLNGQVVSDTGTVRSTFDNSPPDASFGALMGFIEADEMRELDSASVDEVKAAVLKDFALYFGDKAKTPTSFVLQRWNNEAYSRGGPVAYGPPGLLTKYGTALRTPANGIHWAGTETAGHWMGYMDGAVRSGERAAREVLAAL